MAKTSIEWTENNWNWLRGCRRKSPECENCYAEQIAGRFSGTDRNGKILPYNGIATKTNGIARWTGKVSFHETILLEPLKIKKPTKFFVNSMSDTFYSGVHDEWIDKAFAVMALCPQHVFQVLTKRPERMQEYFKDLEFRQFRVWEQSNKIVSPFEINPLTSKFRGMFLPLQNCWLGTSVGQAKYKFRIDILRETPAAVRWLSLEPLLEDLGELDLRGISWVVVGGESGHGARACDISWIRSIVEQCKAANVSCFVKQLGKGRNDYKGVHVQPDSTEKGCAAGVWAYSNKKGSEISEFPEDLRIRQMP